VQEWGDLGAQLEPFNIKLSQNRVRERFWEQEHAALKIAAGKTLVAKDELRARLCALLAHERVARTRAGRQPPVFRWPALRKRHTALVREFFKPTLQAVPRCVHSGPPAAASLCVADGLPCTAREQAVNRLGAFSGGGGGDGNESSNVGGGGLAGGVVTVCAKGGGARGALSRSCVQERSSYGVRLQATQCEGETRDSFQQCR
jgi:hypothetical protein